MNKIINVLFLGLISISISAFSKNFKEDIDYIIIKDNYLISSGKVVLKEYFSLFCSSCRSIENIMPQIKNSMPKNMVFERVHVDFLPGVPSKLQQLMTGAYVLAEKEGRGNAFVAQSFQYIHEIKSPIINVFDVADILDKAGVAKKITEAKLMSEPVAITVNRMYDEQYFMSSNDYLNDLPTLTVNNKYIVVLSSLDKSAPIEDLKNLITYLNEKS